MAGEYTSFALIGWVTRRSDSLVCLCCTDPTSPEGQRVPIASWACHCTSLSCLELAALEDGPIDSGKTPLPISVQQ